MSLVGIASVIGVVAFALPAHAEGSWSSYISGWLVGRDSRTWADNNVDDVSTTVSLSGCSIPNGQAFTNVTLELFRSRTLLPAESKGRRTNGCGTFGWGDVQQGSYHFSLQAINGISDGTGGYNFSASGVTTRY
jgi:hypothetical protein